MTIPIYLDIALAVPLRRTFHYLPPDSVSIEDCAIGCRIEVPFGRQTQIGVILRHLENTDLPAGKLRRAHRLVDTDPVITGTIFELCRWAAYYYHHSIGEVLHTALPVLLRQGKPAIEPIEKLVAKSHDLSALARAPRQRALLNAVMSNNSGKGLTRSELKTLEFDSAIIRTLIEKELVSWQTELDSHRANKAKLQHSGKKTGHEAEFGAKLDLSAEQAEALKGVQTIGTHLLFGVTGSGKTEVYLQTIERVIQAGRQALVLVPEIGLTPQTIARFEQRFPNRVVAMHSGLNNSERLDAWRKSRTGEISVIVGTRSAIFTPMQNPGVIVVDEEHDASFKQQEGFRYSARDLAVKRGSLDEIPVILGSATPSLETYGNAQANRYHRHDLVTRANDAAVANYQIIGIEHQTMTEGFSPTLIKLIRAHLEDQGQVLVFLNRRGFAPVLHCRQCRWLSNCHRCDARMTYHLTTRKLVCHHCDTQHLAPKQCPDCGAKEIVPLGTGTQRLEHGLETLFPDETITRIDRDSTRGKNALEQKIADATQGQRGILLGTQLLAKGHHFPNVTLAAIVDLDSGLFSSDYHATERMGQLLLQVGGRAGREARKGTVAIQTLYPEQPNLNTLINEGYESFCQELLNERQDSQLPPFTYHAIIRAEATKAGSAINFLEGIQQETPRNANVELLGPIPAPMEKRAGRFRAQLLVSSSQRGHLHQVLTRLVEIAETSKQARSVRWSIDIDPYDLF